MDMITKEDLRQIGDLMDEKLVANNAVLKDEIVSEVLTGVGEIIEQNIFPKFDEMDAKFDEIGSKFESVGARFDKLEAKVDLLPTKYFVQNLVTEKVGELRGEMVLGFRRLEGHTDELVQVLKEKEVITSAEVSRVDAVRLFPQRTA
jgi:hypothetical protein